MGHALMQKKHIIITSLIFVFIAGGAGIFLSGAWPCSYFFSDSKEIKEPDFMRKHIDAIGELHAAFPTSADVVFIGDSRVQIPQWSDMFPAASVANRGIGGDTLDGLLKHIDNLGMNSPEVVVLEMGVNDVLRRRQPEFTSVLADQVMKKLKPVAGRMVILEVIDCAVEECDRNSVADLNSRFRALSVQYGAQFVALNPYLSGPEGLLPAYSYDGLHLNAEGYQVLTGILCREIMELKCNYARR